MSLFQLVAPLTETASKDVICESSRCKNCIISRGGLFYAVASFNASRAARKVCPNCFQEILKCPGTAMREKHK